MEAKKNPEADLTNKYGLFLNIGLLISMGLALAAFEFKTYESTIISELDPSGDEFDKILDIPITVQQLPPPPVKVEQPEIEEVPNEEEIIDKIEVVFLDEYPEEVAVEDFIVNTPPIKEEADEIKDFAEHMPEPPGGMEGWAKYLNKNLKYPSQARRMGIQGTVFVAFVVNTDGTIQDVSILRGVDGGCSEEAVRVVGNAPNWKPGRQGGRPVRVKMRLPIRFKLN
ncbi:energy transducer TonB [Echinicola sp. CAU 1574]|uniref:Energy transducer TonB n=1 Tax=Echinicola arenosa TaxID=2774144 RepID=A0ABR9AQ87_9BACT|nr:energy transducer TonB [Echinicola arenosa]MBD8490023.1 energy transducer TonB [Echinicola arenosa]